MFPPAVHPDPEFSKGREQGSAGWDGPQAEGERKSWADGAGSRESQGLRKVGLGALEGGLNIIIIIIIMVTDSIRYQRKTLTLLLTVDKGTQQVRQEKLKTVAAQK